MKLSANAIHQNVNVIWLLMLGLTISTYAVGQMGLSGSAVVLLLLLTVMIKGALIIREFMELRGVSLLWKVMMYGWLSTVCGVIAVTYMIGLMSQ